MIKKDRTPTNDFTPDRLPHNRWELLKDLLLHQPRTLFAVSFLLVLFALPLLSDYLVFSTLISMAYAGGSSETSIFSLFFYGVLISIPCIVILFIGLAGSYQVAKRLCFLEGAFAVSGFYYGVKSGWKKAALMGLIVALSFAFALLGSIFLLLTANQSPIATGVGIGLLIAQFFIVSTMGRYFLSQEFVYANGFFAMLKNSFIFAFVRLPINLSLFLLSPGIILALLAINGITSYVAMALFAIFNSFGVLVWNLYAFSIFDRFINKDHYPALFGKGLFKKKEE